MNSKKNILYSLILALVAQTIIVAQQAKEPSVSKTFFKNGLVAREFYMGTDQMLDSIKTYHITGGLDERFLFDGNNLINGLCQKFSSEGKLKTTWLYKKNVLIKRTDYFRENNLKNKTISDQNYATITQNNELLKTDPNNYFQLYCRATSRDYLEDNVLSEFDFLGFKSQLENIKANPNEAIKFPTLNRDLAEIYSRLGSIYSRFELDNLSINYKLMAIQTDPTDARHYYNLGSFLVTVSRDYRLGISYLEEVIRRVPNHNFAHWALGYSYLELEQYDKAVENINIAFENEANLYENGYGRSETDLATIRGFAYHKLGKTDLGIADLTEALRINDKNSMANRYLGIIYDDLGEAEKACDYFQKAKVLGNEQKYFDKAQELESFIQKTCKEKQTKIVQSNYIAPKDLPYLAPNPAENIVGILNYPISNFKYEIQDINSKKVRQGISDDKTIDVTGLTKGLYILILENQGKLETFKMIKK